MATSFVAAYANHHFAGHSTQSLLGGLASRVTTANLMDALASDCRPVQHLAWRNLVDIPDHQRDLLIEKHLKNDNESNAPVLAALLRAISHDSIPLSDALLGRIASLMTSNHRDVRIAATSVIALRRPDLAIPLLEENKNLDHDLLRALCLADDPRLIVPLMNAFGFPQKTPPPTIGFVISPVWMGEHHGEHPQMIEWLIHQFGYCDDEITPEALNLISAGFSYVTSRMTSDPRATRIAHRWQRRIRSFVWRLLPNELDLEPDDPRPFDAADPFDVDLFIAAVRDSDRLAFADKKQRPPFGRESTQPPTPVCLHASSRYVRKLFVDDPMLWCERWNVPVEKRGEFLFEHARVLLEPDDEARLAADRALRGRWNSSRASNSPRTTVIGDFKPLADDSRLSPAANSVVSLAASCSLDTKAITEWLAEAESRWSPLLVPMGIEVQIPLVDPDRFAAWKEALPFLGVPSPVRPEFGGMLEAAFRPARSFHALALGPMLLNRLGAIAQPQDMALHVSLQGDFSNDAQAIAFPHLFIHPSQRYRNRPDTAMTRVMSKGLVHVHDDAEPLDSQEVPVRRTEFRMFRIIANTDSDSSVKLELGYISDLIAVQILGSAAISPCDRCRTLFRSYADDVEELANQLGPAFHQLLKANYFESTGDPRDEQLLIHLPIFRSWSKVRQTIKSAQLSSSLDMQFCGLCKQHVDVLINHFASDHHVNTSEIDKSGIDHSLADLERMFAML